MKSPHETQEFYMARISHADRWSLHVRGLRTPSFPEEAPACCIAGTRASRGTPT